MDAILTRDQVREVDRLAIQELGIPGVVLMENAGRAAAEYANVAGDQARSMLNLGNNRERGARWFGLDDGDFPLVASGRSFKPNPFGLYDMSVNVSEWCADFLAEYRLERNDDGRFAELVIPHVRKFARDGTVYPERMYHAGRAY